MAIEVLYITVACLNPTFHLNTMENCQNVVITHTHTHSQCSQTKKDETAKLISNHSEWNHHKFLSYFGFVRLARKSNSELRTKPNNLDIVYILFVT